MLAAADPVMAHPSNNGHDPLAALPPLPPAQIADPRPERLVVWGVPDQGYTQAEASLNMRQLASHLGVLQERCTADRARPRWVFGLHSIGRILTPVAREHLCKVAIEQGAEYILMTDNDGIFPVDLFERLVAHDVDVVAPLAFTRNAPHLPVLYQVNQGFDAQERKPYFFCQYVTKYPRNQLVEVAATGFHAVLIKTAILKKMQPPFFFSTTGTGEDIFFCIQAARQAGAKIFVDTSIQTGHLGDPVTIDEAYAQRYWQTQFGITLGTDSMQVVPKADEAMPRIVLGV